MSETNIQEQLGVFREELAKISDLIKKYILPFRRNENGFLVAGQNCTTMAKIHLMPILKRILSLNIPLDQGNISEHSRLTYDSYKEELSDKLKWLSNDLYNCNKLLENEIMTMVNKSKLDEIHTAVADDILPEIRNAFGLLPLEIAEAAARSEARSQEIEKAEIKKTRIEESHNEEIVEQYYRYTNSAISSEFISKYYHNFTDNVELGGFDNKGSFFVIDIIKDIEPYKTFFEKFPFLLDSVYLYRIKKCINDVVGSRTSDIPKHLFINFFIKNLKSFLQINELENNSRKCILNEKRAITEYHLDSEYETAIARGAKVNFNCKISPLHKNVNIWTNLIENTFVIFLLVVKETYPDILTHQVISQFSINSIKGFISELFKSVSFNYVGRDICQVFRPFIEKVNEILGYILLEQSASDGYTCGRGILIRTCESTKLSTILIHRTESEEDMTVNTDPLRSTCGGKRKSKKRRSNKKRTKRSKPRRVRRSRRPAYFF